MTILTGILLMFSPCYIYNLGSATFIISAYLSHEWSTQTVRQTVQSHLVMGWAARLGLFLFARILRDGEDKRFRRAKEDPKIFFSFWTIQGKEFNCLFPLTVFILLDSDISFDLSLQRE